ncbi:hypothetical protein RND81_05G224600 [Saponaria officinalis]|uniref:Transmembrane protein n=1 Tax=Saponaria officinalis TaxID=3572 RepID=A0AAW1KV81_SAPOF
MTQISSPNKIKINYEKNYYLFVFTKFFSLIYSYPLYFSYFIFFSPYLLKLISFIYPLFFTTFLLLLSLKPTFISLNSLLNSKDGFFSTSFDVEKAEKLLDMEEFEFCKFLFDVPTIEPNEANPFENNNFGENPFKQNCHLDEENVDHCESFTMEQKTGDTKPTKVEEKSEQKKLPTVNISTTKVKNPPKFQSSRVNNGEKFSETFPQTVGDHKFLGKSGSMSKEKEWRGTLACFLFEERHNWSNKNINLVNGEECMDLLWEINETEINRGILKEKEDENKLRRKISKIEDLMKNDYDDDQSENFDDHDDGKICCLQALKLSAGKINLRMAKPNFVKISKVFRGIGWLHSQVKKHGKKGYK